MRDAHVLRGCAGSERSVRGEHDGHEQGMTLPKNPEISPFRRWAPGAFALAFVPWASAADLMRACRIIQMYARDSDEVCVTGTGLRGFRTERML